MKKSIKDNRKKGRGRPATGTAPLVGVRMTEEFQNEIKAWAKAQPDKPQLATAVRRLVEIGLSSAKPIAKTSAKTSAKAKDLAGQAIDALADQRASTEERAERKRRLLRGPEEFLDLRSGHKNK